VADAVSLGPLFEQFRQSRKELRMILSHDRINGVSRHCWRRLNFDHLCRLNFDQGLLLT
jgi:hypothetical protein